MERANSYQPKQEVQKMEEPKKESWSTRMNKDVARQIKEQFEQTGDVRSLYMTHAFPDKNFAGIVEQGGLRTPSQLRERGVNVKLGSATGGGSGGSYADKIFFGQGLFHSGYSDSHGVSAGILVPTSEFHRVARVSGRQEHLQTQEERYLDPALTSNPKNAEYVLTETTTARDSARQIGQRMLEQKKIQIQLTQERDTRLADDQFEKEVKDLELPITEFPDQIDDLKLERKKDILIQIELEGLQIPGKIAELSSELSAATKQHQEAQDELKETETRFEQQRQKLPSGIFGKMVGALTGENKSRGIEKARQDGLLEERQQNVRLQSELVQKTVDRITALKKRLGKLKAYKSSLQRVDSLHDTARTRANESNREAEEKYHTTFGTGEEVNKMQARMERGSSKQETDEALKIGLGRSILLIDQSRIEEVLRVVKAKPELATRIVLFDSQKVLAHKRKELEDQEGENITFSNDPLNIVLEKLSTTPEGIQLMSQAQTGDLRTKTQELSGIIRLDEFIRQKEQQKNLPLAA